MDGDKPERAFGECAPEVWSRSFHSTKGDPEANIHDSRANSSYSLQNQPFFSSLECLEPIVRPITAADNPENKSNNEREVSRRKSKRF